jgi:hypothetical protein
MRQYGHAYTRESRYHEALYITPPRHPKRFPPKKREILPTQARGTRFAIPTSMKQASTNYLAGMAADPEENWWVRWGRYATGLAVIATVVGGYLWLTRINVPSVYQERQQDIRRHAAMTAAASAPVETAAPEAAP